MTETDLLARDAIRRTLAACTQAGDVRRADAYAACFAEDGVLELNERIAGREAIRQWMQAPSPIPRPEAQVPAFVSHHLTTCRIDLDGDGAAKVRTYWLVITSAGLDHSGYYDDRFVKAGTGWLIAHRRPCTLWVGPESLLMQAGGD